MTIDAAEMEVPLAGGDVTEGVVRVGDTVRRPASDASMSVRRVPGCELADGQVPYPFSHYRCADVPVRASLDV
jgi:hypothetical protein